ncbi:MAG: SPOR domain-containing protein [Dysgonamonadaceae bacterium]|jgi:cell division protein FtsN|nr:SPOR domain-containing protein [Dysgonamonadaceae bacterium]
MKSKIYLLGFLVICIMFTLNSCKSKESAYKAAYEAAKAREMQEDVQEVNPVEKPKVSYSTASTVVQKEKITVVDGSGSSIQQYNVVIGSFTNKTNALSLKERMENRGYKAFLAQNEKGMYRVIVATFSNKAAAAAERDSLKDKYYPEFQDAWILDKN